MDLFPGSQLAAESALILAGSDVLWYRAVFCPYVREDGSPCFDEVRGSPWIECPLCGGEGAVYDRPKHILGIYSDRSNEFIPDGSGGFIRGDKSFSVSRHLDIRLMKPRHSDVARRILRDKFQLLGRGCRPDGSREIVETLYLDDDTVQPFISSGNIYKIIRVRNNT